MQQIIVKPDTPAFIVVMNSIGSDRHKIKSMKSFDTAELIYMK